MSNIVERALRHVGELYCVIHSVHKFDFEEETEIAAEPIRVDACGMLGLGPL